MGTMDLPCYGVLPTSRPTHTRQQKNAIPVVSRTVALFPGALLLLRSYVYTGLRPEFISGSGADSKLDHVPPAEGGARNQTL